MGRRERDRDRRREEIIGAAQRVFASKGYSAATMEDIASEAELSKGALYLYFDNKEALFLSLASLVTERILAVFEEIEARQLPALEAIATMLTAYSEIAAGNPEKFRILVSWLTSNSPVDTESPSFVAHRERIVRSVGILVSTLESGIADGSIRPDLDPRLTAAELWGAVVGINVVGLHFGSMEGRCGPQSDPPIDRSELFPHFLALLCRGLSPD